MYLGIFPSEPQPKNALRVVNEYIQDKFSGRELLLVHGNWSAGLSGPCFGYREYFFPMPFLTVEQDALHIFGTRTTASSVGGMVLPAFGSKGLKLEVSLNRVHWQPERAQGKYLLGGQALAFVSHHERLLVAQMNPAEKSYLLSHPSEVNNARSLSKFLSGVTLHGDIPF